MKFFTVLFFIAFTVVLVNGQRGSGRRGLGGLVGSLLRGPRGFSASVKVGGRLPLFLCQQRPQPASSSVAPEASSVAPESSSDASVFSSVAPESSSVAA